MAKMMISMKLGDLVSVILWVPVIYFGVALMILVYVLILMIVGGLNPFIFLRKFYPASITAFTLASSNAALPTSMKQIDEVGVSPKVYSFSLPLGATVNMDGSCITLIISALFFAKIFGVPVTSNVLISLFISIIVLSLGSPGVPGGNLVCIALLIPQIGIPAEAISLIMGLYPIVGMAQTCANATGDAVVTTVVAKHEHMMDLSKYK
jgi:Na+/H+-dicarboxylate symporter